MGNDRTFQSTITSTERLGTSRNGNPSWRVHLDNEAVLRTQTDAAIGYEIGNSAITNVPVDITVNGRNEIWNVEPISPAVQAQRAAMAAQLAQAHAARIRR